MHGKPSVPIRYSASHLVRCLGLLVALFSQGCTSLPERNPLPQEDYAESHVLGLPHLRYWADEPHPAYAHLVNPTLDELRALFPTIVDQELHILAISGGGENGAFAAGLLNGWTSLGTRPEFNVVTGISAGALIAPFAFLGSDYDRILEELYTQYATEDLIKPRNALQVLWGESAFDTTPLRALLAKYLDESMMKAIAEEHRRGRLLYIGTTNLDAGRQVTWDIGSIANSGKPGALELIHDVMLASASIPIAFPAVLIKVEANGMAYDEIHVDGGVTRQAFLFNLSMDEDTFRNLNIVGRGQAYVIRNSKLQATWEAVDRRLFSIAERSASSMIRTQGIGDLYREYLGAQKYDFDFHLAYIPDDFVTDNHELFDREYMRTLYSYAYELAAGGYPWQTSPPALKPR